MKSLISALALATTLAAVPMVSFAQNSQPLTRAEVRGELIQLEQAGYKPNEDRLDYPVNIQAAERRVSAEQGAAADSSGYGAPTGSHSQAGVVTPMRATPTSTTYFGN
ncbi:DUF4148 domain-containing protein [Paraburkholderia bonniea]|uniref:DUF4148 domain-containing protein n=1 Tax=Paraburkholderia bonniea TaxID=2152891 RepID=UPI001290E2E3|nr:DUF4148 domain-containing protein [Paraburkholderia bonniea]WJF92088.1 DUF4148 domain-containing protein [Paraburkholderia bonniea]WJF95408.1 DUF4148 domain-containing protein [Paraburkholderia bonniea]